MRDPAIPERIRFRFGKILADVGRRQFVNVGEQILQPIHQPWDYASSVLIDLVRFIDPAIAPLRAYGGQSREILSFGWRDTAIEERLVKAMSHAYEGTHVRLHWQYMLAFYQNLSRPSGLILVVLFALSVAGLVKARGAIRLGTRSSV